MAEKEREKAHGRAAEADKKKEKQASQSGHAGSERRSGPADRRSSQPDRRNPERTAEDFAPRRHPDVKDRRTTT
ncbi:MAG: hypothetical protein KDI31_05565 [Pseudomonadales bacterium]|nr:hypothetical protein [Pseudomonadales bacterium]